MYNSAIFFLHKFVFQINSDSAVTYSILLQNAETVALIRPSQGNSFHIISSLLYFFSSTRCLLALFMQGYGENNCAIPVTSLKVGDNVSMRIQGGARHTGIEIQEFILEN